MKLGAIKRLSTDGESCDHHGTLASHGQAKLIATILGALPRHPVSRGLFSCLTPVSQLYYVFGEREEDGPSRTLHTATQLHQDSGAKVQL